MIINFRHQNIELISIMVADDSQNNTDLAKHGLK